MSEDKEYIQNNTVLIEFLEKSQEDATYILKHGNRIIEIIVKILKDLKAARLENADRIDEINRIGRHIGL